MAFSHSHTGFTTTVGSKCQQPSPSLSLCVCERERLFVFIPTERILNKYQVLCAIFCFQKDLSHVMCGFISMTVQILIHKFSIEKNTHTYMILQQPDHFVFTNILSTDYTSQPFPRRKEKPNPFSLNFPIALGILKL